MLGRCDAIRKRGGRVVFVDPRRTGTVRHASEWLPIRPGTDAALLLALAHVLFAEGRVRLRALGGRVNGVEEVRRIADGFAPEPAGRAGRFSPIPPGPRLVSADGPACRRPARRVTE